MNKEKPRLIESLIHEDFRGILLKPFTNETQQKYANTFVDSYTSLSKKNVTFWQSGQEKYKLIFRSCIIQIR